MQKSILIALLVLHLVSARPKSELAMDFINSGRTNPLQINVPPFQIQNAMGGWQKANPTTFTQSNSNVITEAVNAVNTQYNPMGDGYHYTNVIQVDTQVVAGMNYAIVLQYQNDLGMSEYFEVVIYSAPWNGPDQVVAVRPLESFLQPQNLMAGGWTIVNTTSFTSTNNNLVLDCQNAVNSEFNPSANGFAYSQVIGVAQQVDGNNGIDYQVVLEYSNAKVDEYFDVLLNSAWNGVVTIDSVKQLNTTSVQQAMKSN